MYILGISAYYHDSAAAIVKNGEIIAATQEERFSRIKYDSSFPINAIQYCLAKSQTRVNELDYVVYYENPSIKFKRIMETYARKFPRGLSTYFNVVPGWLRNKLWVKNSIKSKLADISEGNDLTDVQIEFCKHHRSHAASAYYPSPYPSAAVLCVDGVGEWTTTSAWLGRGSILEELWEIKFPHSLGLLYSAFTQYCGFKVDSGEYKLMGLAPYGEAKYTAKILDNLIDIRTTGHFKLNMECFDYEVGNSMINDNFCALFGKEQRVLETTIDKFYADIAASIQCVIEEVMVKLAASLQKETGQQDLCMAGGVALNCVANGKILKSKLFKNIWVQPASGDAGGALGAALSKLYASGYQRIRKQDQKQDQMRGGYLGTEYCEDEIVRILDKRGAVYHIVTTEWLIAKTVELLAKNNVIGWYQGRMEYGPRALGARSIIGNPCSVDMQRTMNLKIKHRESFRPFAPIILEEHVSEWFEDITSSPYMLLVSKLISEKRFSPKNNKVYDDGNYIGQLNEVRSAVPAVTHVDYSGRLQTVNRQSSERMYLLLTQFCAKTGIPMLINTSFNVRGEPIVENPLDAYRCFMRTDMDVLVLENVLLYKIEQPKWQESDEWRTRLRLD